MAHVSLRNSILGRENSVPALNPLQRQVDGLVVSFVDQAADWKSLAAMVAGGMAYRAGRMGVMGFGNGSVVRVVSIGAGLTAEVSVFELGHRGLTTLSGRGGPMWPPPLGSTIGGRPHGGAPTNHVESNLWRWSGPGGLRQGFLQSFITFGTLKSAGRLAQGQNFIAQHILQDTAMVFGHQASAVFGIAPRPVGTLAEQFLHAEATNLQIGAGMALAHGLNPGLYGLERGLDVSLRGANHDGGRIREPLLQAQAASASAPVPLSPKDRIPPGILMMSSSENPKGSSGFGGFLSLRKIVSLISPASMDLASLAREAEENPRHVFALNQRVKSGDADARAAMRNLNVETLAQLAQKDAEAVSALHLLSLSGHWEARKHLRELDVATLAAKAESDPKSLEALISAAGFGTFGNPRAVSALEKLAERSPQAVSALYALSVAGNESAGECLKSLEVNSLALLAKNDSHAFLVLGYLVREGNPRALAGMAAASRKWGVELEILQNLAYEGVEGALPTLAVAAETNIKAVQSLEFLASLHLSGALEALEKAALTNIVAAEALADLGKKEIQGAFEALARTSETNPEALPLLYSSMDYPDQAVAHRALTVLIKGPSYKPAFIPPRLTEAVERFKIAEDFASLQNALDRVATLALENPEAVFFLNDVSWSKERPRMAGIARHQMRTLKTSALALQARWNPSAVMALAYLAERKNLEAGWEMELMDVRRLLQWEDKKEMLVALDLLSDASNQLAWDAFLSFDLKTMALDSPLTPPSLFAVSLLARGDNASAVEFLLREAEGDPRVVFVLNLLAKSSGILKIEEALPKLPIARLAEAAKTRAEAVAALSLLAQKGNKGARTALKNLEASAYTATAAQTRSRNVLSILAAFDNKDAHRAP